MESKSSEVVVRERNEHHVIWAWMNGNGHEQKEATSKVNETVKSQTHHRINTYQNKTNTSFVGDRLNRQD